MMTFEFHYFTTKKQTMFIYLHFLFKAGKGHSLTDIHYEALLDV